MGNGIALSVFMLTCTLMAVGLARANPKARLRSIPVKPLCLFLVVILVMCKSTGSIIYAMFLLPFLIFARPRRILALAGVIAALVLIYPSLRFGGLLPVEKLGSLFSSLSEDRASSLSYRFDMEQRMLDLTRTRPWFGMGEYGRNFLYDPATGKPDTVIDGQVIGVLSTHGLIGFLAFFGPYVFSVLRASRRAKGIRLESDRVLVTALTLACAVILFDLILNATFPAVFIMMMGALSGIVPGIIAEEAQEQQLPGAVFERFSNPRSRPRPSGR
jgi:O-antigen ligase